MGLNAFAERYCDSVAGDVDHAASDDVAGFVVGDELVEAGGDGLLDAEAELALFFVDGRGFWL